MQSSQHVVNESKAKTGLCGSVRGCEPSEQQWSDELLIVSGQCGSGCQKALVFSASSYVAQINSNWI